MPLSEEQLGYSLRSYVLTNRPVQAQWLALLRPDPAPRVRIPDEPLAPRTTLTVSGALAQRKLARQPALPAVPHSDVLGRTVVEVSVNGEGLVETAVVGRESNSKLADTNALILARAVEFEPLPIRKQSTDRMNHAGDNPFHIAGPAPPNKLIILARRKEGRHRIQMRR